ncbi:MAG: FecR domain-containing protein [bacterium]
MLKPLKPTESAEDTMTDRVIKTLAESARPDLSRLRRTVERRLASERDHRQSHARWNIRWAWGLAAACLIGLVTIWAFRDTTVPGTVIITLGDTTITQDSGSRPVSQPESLDIGDTIHSGENGMATLLLSDLSSVRMNHSTSLRLEGRRDIVLDHGSLFADVSRIPTQESEFHVRAGDVTVTVLGTMFEVSRSADGVDVRVEEGRVRVAVSDSTVILNEGESVQFKEGSLGGPKRIDRSVIAAWRRPLLEAEANDPTFIQLMRTYFPSRSLDLPKR